MAILVADPFRAHVHRRLQRFLHLTTRSGFGYFRPGRRRGTFSQISTIVRTWTFLCTFQQKRILQKCPSGIYSQLFSIFSKSR